MSCRGHALHVLLSLPVMLLSGCAALDQSKPPPQPAAAVARAAEPADSPASPCTPTAAESLIAYQQRAGRLPPAELAREYERLAADPARENDGVTRLRLAVLLSQPAASFRDDAQALKLLQEWERANPNASSALRQLVQWQRAGLTERIRLVAELNDAGARLKEEQRHAESYKVKLEALKNLEKNLIERDKR